MATSQQKKARLRRKADKIFQEICRELFDECLICGGVYSCAHHYIPRSRCSALRFDIQNAIPICVGCHCYIHKTDDPRPNNTIVRIKGQEWLDELEAKAKHIKVKDTIERYETVIKNFKLLKPYNTYDRYKPKRISN